MYNNNIKLTKYFSHSKYGIDIYTKLPIPEKCFGNLTFNAVYILFLYCSTLFCIKTNKNTHHQLCVHMLKLNWFETTTGERSVFVEHDNGVRGDFLSWTEGHTTSRMRCTRSMRSNSNSCCIKFKFGEMISLRERTNSNAWSRVKDWWAIR